MSARERVLVIDDQTGVRHGIRAYLELKGFEVEEADSCRSGEAAFRARTPDAVLLDYQLPDGDGVEMIGRLRQISATTPILILTAHGSIELAVKAMKAGADQFLTKPIDMAAVLLALERIGEAQRANRRDIAGRSRRARAAIDPFLGTSDAIRELAAEATGLAPADSPALILGETGVGKGVLSRWIHENGPRAPEAYVSLNCAGLSHDLLESELFGHEAGAFTGASARKVGLLEAAHRGTVFLDEIGDTPAPVQPKILTAVEEKRFRRVGDVKDRHVDIRLIAATHHDLAAQAARNAFRKDLYYRISTFVLRIPPLRERRGDIPILARHIVERLAPELGHTAAPVSPGTLDRLTAYDWPGNIRELRNVLERALILGRGEIRDRDLRFERTLAVQPGGGEAAEPLKLEDVEKRHIESVLRLQGGQVSAAAEVLGISKASLYDRIKRFGIAPSGRVN